MDKILDNIEKYNEITREMIEGCLDDEINEIANPWEPIEGKKIEASEIYKNMFSVRYEEWVNDYCERNNITIVKEQEEDRTFKTRYFELKEE